MPKIGSFISGDGKSTQYVIVNSQAYGKHLRAKRGTHTPLVVTDAMKSAGELLKSANNYAKVIFDAFKPFCKDMKDGKRWSRLVSLFRKQLQKGAIDLNVLRTKFYFHRRRSLSGVLSRSMEVKQAGEAEKSLVIKVNSKSDSKLRSDKTDQYKLTIIVVLLDAKFHATVHSDAKLLPVIDSNAEHIATFALAAGAVTAIIALKCAHYYQGKECSGLGVGIGVEKVLVLESGQR